mmetsp:Transcript_166892/g.530668  ORF Transcript_166892/g.530668 Transcript_166892/m.530668 type:complete len:497 (+) Transcript_166892:57-1547(+)
MPKRAVATDVLPSKRSRTVGNQHGHVVDESPSAIDFISDEDRQTFLAYLKKHADRLAGKSSPTSTIARYLRDLASMGTVDLHHHVFHVAAWVACGAFSATWLPEAVCLLKKELAHKALKAPSRAGLPPRLCFAVRLVEVRAREYLAREELGDDDREVWRELLSALPPEKVVPKDEAARLFQHEASRWAVVDDGARQDWVVDLESRLPAAMDGGGEELRALLRSAVAALTPPRASVGNSDETVEPMNDAAIGRVQRILQSRLRKIVLRILEGGLIDLGHPMNALVLARLQALLAEFRVRHESETAVSLLDGKRWARLDSCLSSFNAGQVPLRDLAASASSSFVPIPQESDESRAVGLPHPLVRLNPDITKREEVQEIDPPTLLRCIGCRALRRSKWVVLRRKVCRFLVPNHGHTDCPAITCRDKGKRYRFEPLASGVRTIDDHPSNFKTCPHGILLSGCFQCSPSVFCTQHSDKPVRRRACPKCRAKGLIAQRRSRA